MRKYLYHYSQARSPFTVCGIQRTHPGHLKWRGRDISPNVLEFGASLPPNGELCPDCALAYARSRHKPLRPPVTPSNKPTSGKSGSGKTIAAIVALVALIVAAVSVFAVYNNREGVDDPAENPVVLAATSTPRTSIVPEITASPAESSESVSSSPDSAASSPAPTPKPDLRFLEADVDPVTLGENVAAQLHAEASLENCFSSHWGIDGLKPYMRYSLAGGYQSNGENISGLSYCIRASDGYRRIGTVEGEIREAMDGLMASPSHRDNILDRWHRKVNIGLAWDRYNFSLVQHFEGDYVKYDRLPEIENGVLRLSGTTRNGATFGSDEDLGVQIYFDPPPHALTPGQVSRTYCYDQGRLIGALRPPLSGDRHYEEDGFDHSHQPCPDPNDVPIEASTPRTRDEALKFWQEAYQASLNAPVQQLRVPWITASEMTARDQSFSLTADLVGLLAEHGDGVYTVILRGRIYGDDLVFSQYSIFHKAVAPEDYHSAEQASFAAVSTGGHHTCGVKTDGSITCWGNNYSGQSTPPDGSFISVSAGGDHSCAIETNSSVQCWGNDSDGRSTPPDASFLSVSADLYHTCGVKTDGSIVCWGDDSYGQSTPPDGSFISVSAGGSHTCGVKADGSIVCWGDDSDGQSTPPDGSFISVSAGAIHTCALTSDGSVNCWGLDNAGQSTPPDDSFRSITAGGEHNCGLKANGGIKCWGGNSQGQTSQPSGMFISVSAAQGYHTCALRADGSVMCWGLNHVGQSTPPNSPMPNP